MSETITSYAQARWRSWAWWDANPASRADLTRAVESLENGLVDKRHEVLKNPAEVAIIASLAAHNSRPLTIGWLERSYDEDRGEWVSKARSHTDLVMVYLDDRGIVVCSLDSRVFTIGSDVVFDIHIQDKVPAKVDEAQALVGT